MPFEIPDHFYSSFTSNVELLLQEKMPVMQMAVETRSYGGDKAQVVKQFGTVEFGEKTARNSDTVLEEIEHKQRWVFPKDYVLALPVDNEDELRMLDSPVSPYVMAMQAAWARKINAVIRDAALGNAQTGVNGSTVTAFDTTNQRIASGSVGLTVAKLRQANEILMRNQNDPSDEKYVFVKAKQMSDLLKTTEATDSAYAEVKALVEGRVNKLLGFNVVHYESLTAASSEDQVIAMVKSAVVLGQWNGLKTRITERADKDYMTQVHMAGTIAATRTQEGKVVEIRCA